jgi:predicted PurR-regulated permease PerM
MSDERAVRGRILWTIAMSLGGIVLLWTLYLLRDALLLVYLSALVATGVNPIAARLEGLFGARRRLPRWLAAVILYAVAIVAVMGVMAAVLPPLVAQARGLWQHVPTYAAAVQEWLLARHVLPREATVTDLLAHVPSPDATTANLVAALQQIIGGVLGLATIALLSFYMLVDAGALRASVLRLWPEARRGDVARTLDGVSAKVGAWLVGQLLLALAIAAASATVFALMGVPYFYVLALICGAGELVPIVGPPIAAVPAVVVAGSLGLDRALVVAGYLTIQQIVEGQIVVPRLMQRRVGIRAVGVIVAIIMGGALAGVLGAMVAVPTAGVIQLLVDEYLERRDARSSSTTMPV